MDGDAFSLGDVPSIDTDKLSGWEEPGDVCPAYVAVVVDDVEFTLRCEVEGVHDEHEATLRWVNDDEG